MSLALSRHSYFVEGSDDRHNLSLQKIGLSSQANDILLAKRLPHLTIHIVQMVMTWTKGPLSSKISDYNCVYNSMCKDLCK